VFFSTLIASDTINPNQYGMSKVKVHGALTLWKMQHSSPIEQAFDDLYHNFGYEALPHSHELLTFLKLNSSVILGTISNSDERIETALTTAG